MQLTAKNSSFILHFIPARIDLKLATFNTYKLVQGLYLDHKLDGNTFGYTTILMDVDGGEGWPNLPAHSIIPFMNSTTFLLQQYYTEQLDELFLYTIP